MKFNEAIQLLKEVSDYSSSREDRKLRFLIYEDFNDHFILYAKAHSISQEYHDYLGDIIRKHNLQVRNSDGYLVIYKPQE